MVLLFILVRSSTNFRKYFNYCYFSVIPFFYKWISWVILSCLPQILIQNTKDFYLIQIFKFSQLYWICSSYIVLMQSEIWHSVHDHSRIRHTSLKENSCIFIPYFVQWRVKSVFRPLIGLQRMEMQRSVERWNIRHNSSCKCFIQHFLNVV